MRATLVLALFLLQQEPHLTSGGPLPREQAAYDVLHYRLELSVDPEAQSIEGSLTMRARLLEQSPGLLLDLDDRLEVRGAQLGELERKVDRRGGRLRVLTAGAGLLVGEEFTLRIDYGGQPRVAPRPPWDGGFVWARTSTGAHWIATANQMQGADLWWPCKDQPSDEPEGMDLLIEVPEPLVCASNGRLLSARTKEGRTTFHWRVSTPINTYGVALNIAPYRTITAAYSSVAGDTFPVTYWVLPENYEKGQELFRDILRQTRWFEETFGPYPFRADKYGVAETPHLGMEHQTITAYGNAYRGNPWGAPRGFDFLHHHEMAHEWWGNLVTCRDWKDFWIHEGFATYCQALYTEHLQGAEGYRGVLAEHRAQLLNLGPVAPRESKSSAEVYFGAAASDIYYKGSWVLHSLRFLLGDEMFFTLLRRMAYPDAGLEHTTDGSACRTTDTEELRALVEALSGRDLSWFFDVYLHQAQLPRLVAEPRGTRLLLHWEVPGDLPFPMPVEVLVGDERRRVEMPDGRGFAELDGRSFELDPDGWLLRAEEE